MKCALDLRAASSADLISIAGGWLCDRVMAGWTVTVWVSKLDDARSSAILGVTARELVGRPEGVDALVVRAVAAQDTARDGSDCVRHHVSAAARTFKSRALLAAGLPPNTADLEMFLLGTSSKMMALREFVHTSALTVAP
ncbi:hypothetical protein H7I53_16675 [Mycolicibacterium pulveris]|uniref:Uncharacterized protein n=1 Tax=Mycolicibacterium pulveris TaxID=36813 RepID=A0A7I7UDH8_MYCPV|nr:hypothetical protein [Mycolicibacterium pulveris]MCV6981850.1 hypothetical protein [Mycolicibacterium pulveris]BBY79150.1 hypothetical protein MPUL_03080 [Mycolicibacterium pulveris]